MVETVTLALSAPVLRFSSAGSDCGSPKSWARPPRMPSLALAVQSSPSPALPLSGAGRPAPSLPPSRVYARQLQPTRGY